MSEFRLQQFSRRDFIFTVLGLSALSCTNQRPDTTSPTVLPIVRGTPTPIRTPISLFSLDVFKNIQPQRIRLIPTGDEARSLWMDNTATISYDDSNHPDYLTQANLRLLLAEESINSEETKLAFLIVASNEQLGAKFVREISSSSNVLSGIRGLAQNPNKRIIYGEILSKSNRPSIQELTKNGLELYIARYDNKTGVFIPNSTRTYILRP